MSKLIAGRDTFYTKEDLEKGVPIPAPLFLLVPAIRDGSIKGAKFDNRPRRGEFDDLKKELKEAKKEIEELKKKVRLDPSKSTVSGRSRK